MSTRAGLTRRGADLKGALARVRSDLSRAESELDRQRRFTDVLLETLEEGIVFCDADGSLLARNRAGRDLLGLEDKAKPAVSPEVAAARVDVFDLAGEQVPVTDYPPVRALRGEDVDMVELKLGPQRGPHREVVSHSAQIVGAEGVILGAVTTLADVSVERASLRQLAQEHQKLLEAQVAAQKAESRFQTLFDQAGVGAAIIGLDGVPTQVNAAACHLLGRPSESLVGRQWAEYLAPGQVPTAQIVEFHLAAGHDTFGDERRYIRPDGSIVWVTVHIALVRDELGEPDYLLAQFADITERKQMELDRDHQAALHDSLTGLPNRALFADRVMQALLEASSEPVAVVVMLVAGLHGVIDKDGYAAGDMVLKEVGQRLSQSVHGDVTIGHLQPGQFAVLIKGGTQDSVRAAEQSLATLDAPIQLPSGSVTLSASLGICAAPSGPEDAEALVARLIQDAAVAAGRAVVDGAKTRRRQPSWGLTDAIAFASPDMRQEQEDKDRTELLLREALDNDMIRVAYQPVVDLATGTVVGAEALLRVSDRDGRAIPPQELIPVAEESGLIVEIGIRVLRLAAQQVADWLAGFGVLLPVAVNVSVVQLDRVGFLDEVLLAADMAGLPPDALSIELTESVLLESDSASIEKLKKLRDAGIQLAIDDFGTGYASLSYLRDLPASTLKIDRSFVEGIPHDRAAEAIVASVIGLARNFGMTCIAEGIETDAQLRYLAGHGIHGQGYLLGRPGEGSAISETLERERRDEGTAGLPKERRVAVTDRRAAATVPGAKD